MKKLSIWLLLIFLSLSTLQIFAQLNDPGMLTLDRLYASSEFRGERFGPTAWTTDGNSYTTLEESTTYKDAEDLVRYDAKTGVREVLIPANKLIPKDSKEPLSIEEYSWTTDGQKLIVFTNGQRVWRYNTRGDYWIYDMKTSELYQLGKQCKPATLMFAKIAPDGTHAAYVSQSNLYVEDLTTHAIKQLTTNGSKTIINGTFDWCYEEEFDCRDGFRWSPDSKKLAYWQLDASGVRDFLMINNTDSLYPFTIPVQYPKVGETLSAAKVGVIGIDGGETIWMKLTGYPRNNYIPRMEWAESSDEVLLQYMNRLQNVNHVYIGKVVTGDLTEILTERDSTWVDPNDDIVWFNKGKAFSWISERNGWKHVYQISRDGLKINDLTPGNFDVNDVLKIDEKSGYIYYIALPDNPTQRYLYRNKLNGKGKPELLTPADKKGYHSYDFSPNLAFAIHRFTKFDIPGVVDLIEIPTHKTIRMLVENKTLIEKLATLKSKPVEYFKLTIPKNVQLDGWMMKPYNFDSTKKYPVLFYVYGEPAGATTLDAYGRTQYLWHKMLTQKGYIVISVDTRGTPLPKGRAWRKSAYQKLGILNSYEQAMAAQQIGRWSFIDSTRFAIWGWSGGGSSTLNAMFRYPDIYKTGMAVAPVPEEALYDAIYQERYLGLLKDSPQVYKDCSAITFAKNLKGNLLIVHGTGDDNVHYQGVERLINELVKNNRQFTMMSYPNRSHGIFEGRGTTMHLQTLLTNYLLNNLPKGGK